MTATGPATDPRGEPGREGAVAEYPYWLVVVAFVLVALVGLALALLVAG
ncbi:hypothetical protein BH23CHL7_BH23CHL7_20930 [soil metagenome]